MNVFLVFIALLILFTFLVALCFDLIPQEKIATYGDFLKESLFFIVRKIQRYTSHLCMIISKRTKQKSWGTPLIASHTDKQRYQPKILLVSLDATQGVKAITKKFCETIYQDGTYKYKIDLYNAAGNFTHLKLMSHLIVQQEADLIFTIGAHATISLQRAALGSGCQIPHIFGGVKKPHELGIVPSLEEPGGLITGNTDTGQDYDLEIEMLLFAKPHIKKVLIIEDVYNFWKKEMAISLQKALTTRGVYNERLKLYSKEDIAEKIYPLLHGKIFDTIITTSGQNGIPKIAEWCNLFGITFLASDIFSIKEGATLGFGNDRSKFGLVGAHQVLSVLEEHKNLSEIPVIRIKNENKLHINFDKIEKQGLRLTETLINMKEKVKIHKS